MNRVTYEFEYRLDFMVFYRASFHDIMGIIAKFGLCYENLLQEATNDALPIQVYVGKLLDDDTMQRVY